MRCGTVLKIACTRSAASGWDDMHVGRQLVCFSGLSGPRAQAGRLSRPKDRGAVGHARVIMQRSYLVLVVVRIRLNAWTRTDQ